jgi:hypothetical protein
MTTKTTPWVYDSLGTISRSFEQILQELERLQQLDWFRGRAPIKAVESAVREMRAWTVSEILDVLHQEEESRWMRLGRVYNSREERSGRRADVRAKRTGQKRPATQRI